MEIGSILFIVLGLTLARGQDYSNVVNDLEKLMRMNRSPNNGRPMNATQKNLINLKQLTSPPSGRSSDCRGMQMRLHEWMAEVRCKPTPTLIKLSPSQEFTYLPDVVLVDRCNGRCYHSKQSCMATESVETKVIIQRIQFGRFLPQCMEITVEKHVECGCDCTLMAHHCNGRQKYNEDACTCDCANIEEIRTCAKKEDMYWDSDTCRCICLADEEICSSGLMWVPSICRCARVIMDKDMGHKSHVHNSIHG